MRINRYVRPQNLPANAPGAPYPKPMKDVYAEVPSGDPGPLDGRVPVYHGGGNVITSPRHAMAASTPAKRPRCVDASSEWQPCLSSEEVDTYHREGWLIPKASLSVEEVARFRQSLDRVIAQNPSVRPELLVSAHLEAKGKEGVAGSHDFLQLGLQPLILEVRPVLPWAMGLPTPKVQYHA
eukprot:s237_g26.t1